MADITDVEDLMGLEASFAPRNAARIMEFVNSKDFSYLVKRAFNEERPDNGCHCHPQNTLVPYLQACTYTVPPKTAPVVHFAVKLDEAVQHKLNLLLKYGRMFINHNGGFMVPHKDLEVTETILAKTFPQYSGKDVKVSQYPTGGIHWYTTLHGEALSIDGRQKWDTKEDAEAAVQRWMKA